MRTIEMQEKKMSLNEIQLQKEEMQETIRLKEIEIEIEEKQRADEI